MKLIPFTDLNDEDEFWRGARFIKKKTGLMNVKEENDYYEYMLIDDKGNSDGMICAHIDEYESGKVISYVRKTTNTNRITVLVKEFKRSNIPDEELHLWFYHEVKNDRCRLKKS